MKNFITFLAIVMAIIFLFTSCGSSLTITKRHHTNGYYVSYNKMKKSESTKTNDFVKEKELELNQNVEFNSSLTKKEPTTPISVSEDVLLLEESSENETPSYTEDENSEETKTVKSSIGTSEKVHQSIVKIKKSFFDQKELKSPQPREDGLSLLWIIILVVLILWALGYIGGWGGGLIHLLLVIALILLILWLLGII